ncbi:MAG: T9SS type A sorting domain-containing protein, partial [Candidatus Firestonebacteria bacterium]|nr:T9SS type A sorting domain-containing protein [Candidatus Firestonebacteria bacterium]
TKYYYLSDPLEWVLYQGYVTGGWFKIIGTYDYGPDLYNTVGVTIDTTCSVGINELLMDKNVINIYPNPTSDILFVEYAFIDGFIEGNTLIIYNMKGEKVKEVEVKEKIGYTEIRISDLPNGVYIVSLGGNKEFSVKFTVNK